MTVHLMGKEKIPCACEWCAGQVPPPRAAMSTMSWPWDADGRELHPQRDGIVFGRALTHD